MASIRKRGKSWYAEVRKRGVYESASFTTKAEATEWAAEIERKIRSGGHTMSHKRTLGDLLERYADEVSPKKAGHKWEVTRIYWFLQQDISRVLLAELRPLALAQWRDKRLTEVSGETIRRDMALISHALRVATNEWGWLHESPMTKVSRPTGNPGRERIATDDEIEAICFVAGYQLGEPAHTDQARVAAAFVLSVETGMRGGEICSINVPCPVGTSIRLPKTKNGTARDVPLSQIARQVLNDVGGDFRLNQARKDALFRKMRERAAITGLNFHDGRHTAITRLAQKLNPLELARMVGHRDLKMLMRYYNESADIIAKKL